MITTGQQAGFLTGPLYTIYKALTVARLAAVLEQQLGVLVLPVFWTASEDHDWPEVDHVHIGTRRGVRRVQLQSPDSRALQMSNRRLGNDVESAVDKVLNIVAYQAITIDHIKQIVAHYRAGETVANAFAGTMASLLEPFDFLLTDAADPALKRASVPVLRHALEDSARHEQLLSQRGEEIRVAGFTEQVAILDGATNVFYSGGGERARLYRRGEGFVAAGTTELLPRAVLLQQLEESPGVFSPNVLLRPIVESAVFPTLGYVAGPGEIAYYGQLGVLYPEFGMRAPVVYPRFSATLVESWVEKDLEHLSLQLRDLEQPRHELIETLARQAMPESLSLQLKALGESLAAGYRELIQSADALDPTLRGALGRLRNESLSRVGSGERKILRALKRREEAAIGRIDRARDAVFPAGGPQERTLNILPFLAIEPQLLEMLFGAIEIALDGGASAEHAKKSS